MPDVIKAMKESHAIKKINAGLKSGTLTPHASKYAKYLVTDKEMWARAYAQWVAKKSGDGRMLGQLDRIRFSNEKIDIPSQWSDADFVPIANKIDALMEDIGWL